MNNKTLIVHIVTRLYLGGAQRVCLDIMKDIAKTKSDCVLITGRDEMMTAHFKKNNIRIITVKELDRPLNLLKDIIAFFKISMVLKQESIKYHSVIVHTHTTKAGILGRWSAYFAGIRSIVHTAHGWAFYREQNLFLKMGYALIERITARFTSLIIAVSKSVMTLGLEMGVGKRHKYRVIENGLSINRPDMSREELLNRLKVPKGKKYVLQISCLKEQKDPLSFLHIAEYMQSNRDYHFILAGDGSLRGGLESFIKTEGLTNITMLGWYNRTDELYSIANIVTLTSRFEGMPLVILEAMHYGIPLILSDIDVHREFVDMDFICRRTDYGCYKDKILYYSDKRIKYPKQYSLEMMNKGYGDLYYELQNAKSCKMQR